MPDAEPLTLPAFCPACGQRVTVLYQPTQDRHAVTWTCPYIRCARTIQMRLRGSICRVDVRDLPKE
jgi:hypothetical protein